MTEESIIGPAMRKQKQQRKHRDKPFFLILSSASQPTRDPVAYHLLHRPVLNFPSVGKRQ